MLIQAGWSWKSVFYIINNNTLEIFYQLSFVFCMIAEHWCEDTEVRNDEYRFNHQVTKVLTVWMHLSHLFFHTLVAYVSTGRVCVLVQ